MIEKICKSHTTLNDEEILIIKNVAKNIQLMSNLIKADVFIDCITSDVDVAIVVAEAKPMNRKSLYNDTVVGQFAYRHNEPAVIRTLEIGMATRDLRGITQEDCSVKQDVEPILGPNGNVIACLIVEKDVSEVENKNAHMEILSETAEQLTETLMDRAEDSVTVDRKISVQTHLNDGVVIFDKNGIVTSINPVASALYREFGYIENLVGVPFDNLVLDGSKYNEVILSKVPKVSEVEVRHMILKVKYANMRFNELSFAGVIMVIKDITGERAIEKELILKSVAIREIHHRVKNNLQTISSLLRLQARRISDEAAKQAFEESINRVNSIAVTHEILARNGVDEVKIKTILYKITKHLTQISENGQRVNININGDDLSLTSDRATTIALVINELVQNSIQYAFSDRPTGKIDINIATGIRYTNISVIDDGIGFDVSSKRSDSLGLKIVKSMIIDKLKGQYNIESNEFGTKIIFDFKL